MNTEWLHREIHREDFTPEFLLAGVFWFYAALLITLALGALFGVLGV